VGCDNGGPTPLQHALPVPSHSNGDRHTLRSGCENRIGV